MTLKNFKINFLFAMLLAFSSSAFAGFQGQFLGDYWGSNRTEAYDLATKACKAAQDAFYKSGKSQGLGNHPNQVIMSASAKEYRNSSGAFYKDFKCGVQFSEGGWNIFWARAYYKLNGTNGCAGLTDPDTKRCYSGVHAETSGMNDFSQCKGNPIDIMSGVKTQYEIDFKSEVSELMEFVRIYDSKSRYWYFPYAKYTNQSKIAVLSPVQTRLYSFSKGRVITLNIANEVIEFTDARLQKIHFMRANNAHTYQPVTRNIKANMFVQMGSVNNSEEPKQEWVYIDGLRKEVYNSNGFLKTIEFLNEKLTVRYSEDDGQTIYTHSNGEHFTLSNINSNGKDFRFEDVDGNTIDYEYEGNNLTTVIFSDGSKKTYHYENEQFPHALTGLTNELGVRFATWAYDSLGRANLSMHANDAERYDFVYDTANKKVIETRIGGKKTIYHYQAKTDAHDVNKIIKIEGVPSASCLGADSYYSYLFPSSYENSKAYIKTETDKNGNVIETARNNKGFVVQERRGLQWISGVNSTLRETLASQKINTVWHDDFALPISRVFYGWNGSIYKPYKKIDISYTSSKRIKNYIVTDLTDITMPYTTYGGVREWQYEYVYYDQAETILKQKIVNGPRVDVIDETLFNYDEQGHVSSIQNALGQTTYYSDYNARGLIGRIVDSNGVETNMLYTSRGWLDSLVVDDIVIGKYTYYANGLLQKVLLADQSWLEYSYNDAGHLIKIANNNNEAIHYVPTLQDGKWISETILNSNGVIQFQRERIFDELGRVMKLQGQHQQSLNFSYDKNDNLYNENDALERLTSYQYDEQNRITNLLDAEQNAKEIEVDKKTIAFAYDIQGNVSSVKDQRDNVTHYLYNGFGELIRQKSPDTGETLFYYDSAGNLSETKDARGITKKYSYDELNRLHKTSHTNNSSEDIAYSYDEDNKSIGYLTSVRDGSGLSSFLYDGKKMTKSSFCILSSQCYRTQYIYNTIDQLTGVFYPSGNSVLYTYDNLGRVKSVDYQELNKGVEPIISDIEYYPFGGMKSVHYATGFVYQLESDRDGKVSVIQGKTANNGIFHKTYSYNAVNNIEDIVDHIDGDNSRSYIYDKLSRLTKVTKGANKITTDYQYDEVGNRQSKKVKTNTLLNNEVLKYADNSNQLINFIDDIAGVNNTFSYDPSGNVISKNNVNADDHFFIFNSANRMSFNDRLNGMLTNYLYNAFGQRVIKIPGGDFDRASYFHYGINGQLLAEYSLLEVQPKYENIFVNGLLLAQMQLSL